MEAIVQADGAILLWIQQNLRSDLLTPIMKGLSLICDKGIIWIAVTLALLAFRKTRRLGVMCAISMILGLVITNVILKNWVARVRPYEVVPGLECLVGAQKDFSFPSGHATNSLACSWVLFRRAPKRWWGICALILALLICWSRLYVGVHYPTDVLCGILIGIFCAVLAMWIEPKLEKRFPAILEW